MADTCCPIVRPIGAVLPVGQNQWGQRVGPFFINQSCAFDNSVFGIFINPSDNTQLQAWASTDMGFSWAVVAGGGFPSLGAQIDSFDCGQDGSVVRVATQLSTGVVAYHVFDMTTKTWTLYNEQVSDGSDANSMHGTPYVVSLCVRSSGEPCIAYASSTQLVGVNQRARCRLRYKSGGVWSTPVLIGNQGTLADHDSRLYHAIAGSNQNVHLFFGKAPGSIASATDDDVQTMKSDFSLTSIHTWLTHGISGYLNPGRYATYNGGANIIYPGRDGGEGEYVLFTSSNDITTYDSIVDLGEVVQQGTGTGVAAMFATYANGAPQAAYVDWSFGGANLWVRTGVIGSDTKISFYYFGSNNTQELDGRFLNISDGVSTRLWSMYFYGFSNTKTMFLLVDTTNASALAALTESAWEATLASQDATYKIECSGCTVAIPPGSSYEADSFIDDLRSSVPVPNIFTLETADVLTVTLLPPPNVQTGLEYVYIPYPPDLPAVPNGTVLNVPDDLTPFIKYGTLADLFGKAGETSDPVRREFCEQLFTLGSDTAKTWVATD